TDRNPGGVTCSRDTRSDTLPRGKGTGFGIADRLRTGQDTGAGEEMAHQFVRLPLRAQEADRLAHACPSPEEKLIVWSLLDTGPRVSELCSLTLDDIQWQQRALRVSGKGAPTAHGANSGSSHRRHGSARSWSRISP